LAWLDSTPSPPTTGNNNPATRMPASRQSPASFSMPSVLRMCLSILGTDDSSVTRGNGAWHKRMGPMGTWHRPSDEAGTGYEGQHRLGGESQGYGDHEHGLAGTGGVPRHRPGRIVRAGRGATQRETSVPGLPGTHRVSGGSAGQPHRIRRVGRHDGA